MMGWYREVDGVPVSIEGCPTPATWSSDSRIVAKTWVRPDVEVSTVFLALDHRFTPGGPPLLYETMVFRNGSGEECVRYSTRAEAHAGHEAMCEQVRKEED
jgi:hypothetical protein